MLPTDLPRSPWLIVHGLTGLVGALASLPCALALFHWAAQYDRHYYPSGTRSRGPVIREHPGLFLLVGGIAMLPAIIGVMISRVGRRRGAKITAVLVGVVVVVVAGLCELVVTMAPEPWFAF